MQVVVEGLFDDVVLHLRLRQHVHEEARFDARRRVDELDGLDGGAGCRSLLLRLLLLLLLLQLLLLQVLLQLLLLLLLLLSPAVDVRDRYLLLRLEGDCHRGLCRGRRCRRRRCRLLRLDLDVLGRGLPASRLRG